MGLRCNDALITPSSYHPSLREASCSRSTSLTGEMIVNSCHWHLLFKKKKIFTMKITQQHLNRATRKTESVNESSGSSQPCSVERFSDGAFGVCSLLAGRLRDHKPTNLPCELLFCSLLFQAWNWKAKQDSFFNTWLAPLPIQHKLSRTENVLSALK